MLSVKLTIERKLTKCVKSLTEYALSDDFMSELG